MPVSRAMAPDAPDDAYVASILAVITHTKPRLTEIEDISKAKRKMKITHVAPDAV
ncbi:hypothetical protein [Thiocapsa sp.]|uniref:hypothetical protein n=1 Tax=Thiocapsa sp. TaxID=2024551 RepID=UPI0025FB4B6F|nr:hypothetical protein [Thiocapsa sp.]